jgi:hypothetical protein
MQLVANKLLGKYGQTTPIYTLSGWNKNEVKEATGWNAYLKQETGVSGDRWPTYPAYLLLDEAQQSYWDDRLWADLFKAIQPGVGPFVILFSSYGSPNRGFAGFDEQYIKTPMVFAAEQQISLRPDESIGGYLPILIRSSESTEFHTCRPVGLLLDEDEVIDVATRYISDAIHPSPSLSADLKKGFFLFSEGHTGLLISLLYALQNVPVSVFLTIYSPDITFINSNINLFYNRNFMPLCGEISRLIGRLQASISLVNLGICSNAFVTPRLLGGCLHRTYYSRALSPGFSRRLLHAMGLLSPALRMRMRNGKTLSRKFGATVGSTQRRQNMMFATYFRVIFTVGRYIF